MSNLEVIKQTLQRISDVLLSKSTFIFMMCVFLWMNFPSPCLAQDLSPDVYSSLKYRHIGPEGNRVIAIAGQYGNPHLIYVGAASGGIWKTTDGGLNWKPVFDNQDVSSIGALAVATSDPNIIWAGTGETNIRSSISIGNGIYKSVDGGQSWEKMGLEKTGRISRVVIHPQNPDIVLAAAMGHCYGPQEERGVYRTINGGETWEHVLFTDENTGASDIAMDPQNPRNLVAGMWPLEIKTWQRNSGGENGGLFLSKDSGKTWEKCTQGLPQSPTGKIAVAYAPSNPSRIYALIETDQYQFKGVLWGSKDDGASWDLISYDQQYHTRPHYYSRLAVSPDNENEIWFLASRVTVSLDGGKTGKIKRIAGHDAHDIWFDTTDPKRVLIAHDGGVRISHNHGESWFHPDLPVAQMYHVAVDQQVPYFVYGNQQDGPTYRIPSRRFAGSIITDVGGGESGFTVPDYFDNNIIWASNEQGVLTKHNLRSGMTTDVQVWPETPVGRSPRDIKYRWVWCNPWILSTHTQNTLYAGSQFVHKTSDAGYTWQIISPDLTTNDTSMQVNSGGLTYDNVGVDYGTTLYALAESPRNKDVLWAGSNDGLVHMTRNGGETWVLVSENIPDLPPLGTVTSIEASRFEEGVAYLTFDFHQVNDRDPYVYKTADFGESWTKIIRNLPKSMFSYAQIIREDPERQGMLYLGTENAIYFSLNDGEKWLPLRNNLPPAPVRWLTIQEAFGDLVISTYGRGFWILDDVSPLRQINDNVLESACHFFKARPAYRFQRDEGHTLGQHGDYYQDPPRGAALNYYLKKKPDAEVKISILNADQKLIRSFTGSKNTGLNRVYWDLKHQDSPEIELRTPPLGHPGTAYGPESIQYNKKGWRRLSVEGSGPDGPLAAPGIYTVIVEVDGKSYEQDLEVLKDPKSPASLEDIREQIDLALKIQEKVTSLVKMGNSIEWIRKQIYDLQDFLKVNKTEEEVIQASKTLDQKFIEVEQKLFILRTTGASENLLRFPQQLYSHLKMLGYYVTTGDARPTKSKYEVFEELSQRLQQYEQAYQRLLNTDMKAFNTLLSEKGILAINALEHKWEN
jgi:photosystem II stability/assembly factor-like uncharacterized protein